MKKTLSRLLVLVMLLGLFPTRTLAAGPEEQIATQIRAFAKSLDSPNADSDAAWALARHGISARGKTLKASQTHPLTATLLNSEMGLATLIRGCYRGIRTMEQMGLDEVYDDGGSDWTPSAKTYVNTIYSDASIIISGALYYTGFTTFTGKFNDYDNSLVWMAGSTEVHTHIRRLSVTADTITYRVTTVFEDRFDFNTSNGSVPRELASLLGSFLFKEFNWTATAEFTLTVPNTCTHAFDSYHWYYDAEMENLVSGGTTGFGKNPATLQSSAPYGAERRYFELSRPVQLRHSIPWVLEYTIKDPDTFTISPTQTASALHPYLLAQQRTHLFFQTRHRVDNRYQYVCHGYTLANLFDFNGEHSFTVRLENLISEDGTNTVSVSVYNNDLQKTVLEPAPMDDRYRLIDGVLHPETTESSDLSGRDFRISYIGNALYGFHFRDFDLKVWENGMDVGKVSGFDSKTLAPTCTSPGYATRVCTLCHMEETQPIPMLAHIPGPEADCTKTQQCTVCGTELSPTTGHIEEEIPGTAPDCETAGRTEGSKCSTCGEILKAQEEIPALGHLYKDALCTRCGGVDPDFLPGDANENGALDYDDALRVLRASIGLETLPKGIAKLCDRNGNDILDYDDALLILRASIGL